MLRRLTLVDYFAAVGDAAARLRQPPIIIGHSMGGLLAMQFAAGSNCAGLVVVATPSPRWLPVRLGSLRYGLAVAARALAGLPVNAPPEVARALATHDLSVAESTEIIAQGTMESGRVLRRLAFGGSGIDLSEIRCPVLCLAAGEDRVVPRTAGARISAATGGELVEFPGHGHWLIAGSLTGTVAATVVDWLGRRF